tara:strand:- start:419 stop:670 length:252 start_codon:yes stop_codon:yes gene_type:complete
MSFKDYIKEGEVKLTGRDETVQRLKDLKLSVDDWISAAEASDESQTSKFIIIKSVKSINSNLRSVAKAIDIAIKMEDKYKGRE